MATTAKEYSAKVLTDLKPAHEFFIGIDSDGCVFDSMELKHKECFIPQIIYHFRLQSVSKYTREAAEFVNLYSKWRGANRFPALLKVMDLMAERKEVRARGVEVPKLAALRKWMDATPRQSNPALQKAIDETGDAELKQVMAWSKAVNESIEWMVFGVKPFPFVHEFLVKGGKKADMIVVSQTPVEALEREWDEHDLTKYVGLIAGQEHGTKGEHLKLGAGDKYPHDKKLMIGDALGDLKAANEGNCLFFPINPGHEEASWERLAGEGLDRFFAGTFAGAYQQSLMREFEALLPDTPKW